MEIVIDEIQYEVSGHIGPLTINRPGKMNAMTDAMYAAIGEVVRSAERDSDVRCVILTGSGPAFTSGHDLGELADASGGSSWQPYRPERFDNGLECSKPLIAGINGYALAGGLELSLFCEIRIASKTAQFGAPEVKWGILHGYGTVRLPDVIGMSNTLQLLLTGDFIDADAALRMGLVSEVVLLAPRHREILQTLVYRTRSQVRRWGLAHQIGHPVALDDMYESCGALLHISQDLSLESRISWDIEGFARLYLGIADFFHPGALRLNVPEANDALDGE
jgi:enoyl-CoA hydratase/carnithine racemase